MSLLPAVGCHLHNLTTARSVNRKMSFFSAHVLFLIARNTKLAQNFFFIDKTVTKTCRFSFFFKRFIECVRIFFQEALMSHIEVLEKFGSLCYMSLDSIGKRENSLEILFSHPKKFSNSSKAKKVLSFMIKAELGNKTERGGSKKRKFAFGCSVTHVTY